MKTLDFKHDGHLPILLKNATRSKALEPVCLFGPPHPPIVTQSRWREGRVRGKNMELHWWRYVLSPLGFYKWKGNDYIYVKGL